MLKTSPLIVLLTDFGIRDQYVGVMKGVLAARAPLSRIIDLSHDVASGDIREAGYLLWSAFSYFPKRTVFVCVVDPGVGTSRNILIAQNSLHTFIAPDNGLLDFVFFDITFATVTALDVKRTATRRVLPSTMSTTFHGRDIFSPVAAYVATGGRVEAIGNRIIPARRRSPFIDGIASATKATILHIDRFGNIVTNIRARGSWLKYVKGVKIGNHTVRGWAKTFADAPVAKPSLLMGSSGLVEIVCRNSSAASTLHAQRTTSLKMLYHS